jgi:hypothetical protein
MTKTCPVCGDIFPVSAMRAHVAGTRCLAEAGRMGRYWHQTRGEKLVALAQEVDKLLELDVAEGPCVGGR